MSTTIKRSQQIVTKQIQTQQRHVVARSPSSATLHFDRRSWNVVKWVMRPPIGRWQGASHCCFRSSFISTVSDYNTVGSTYPWTIPMSTRRLTTLLLLRDAPSWNNFLQRENDLWWVDLCYDNFVPKATALVRGKGDNFRPRSVRRLSFFYLLYCILHTVQQFRVICYLCRGSGFILLGTVLYTEHWTSMFVIFSSSQLFEVPQSMAASFRNQDAEAGHGGSVQSGERCT